MAANDLVMPTTNRVFDTLSQELGDLDVRLIGDAQAARLAPFAFYEGRRAALEL